jgi:hypothetical protein
MKQLFLFITFWFAFLTAASALAQMPESRQDTARANNLPADVPHETVIDKGLTGLMADLKTTDETLLYPNPAVQEINIVYSAQANIKSIAIYNIIGRILTVYKVSDNNSANLQLENIPSGVYFVRLFNSSGEAVVTKKFTKQ